MKDLFEFLKSHGKVVPVDSTLKQQAIAESKLQEDQLSTNEIKASETQRKSKRRPKAKLLANYDELTFDMVKAFHPNTNSYTIVVNCLILGGDAVTGQKYAREMFDTESVRETIDKVRDRLSRLFR